ncbi:MAG TPA: AsmA family protein [Noviherbaspirillum sp.]
MSRPAKILAWSMSGLFAVLALAVAVLLSFDWNRVTPWINSHVSEATGRRFSIDGKLALTWHAPPGAQEGWRHWIPWPHLTAKDVSFGNPDWASEADMAHAREITFSVNPLALLNHRIVIPLLALEAPHLSLERLHDGRNNWTFKKTGDGPSAWQLDLQQLILTQASIHLLDAVKRADLTANIDTLGSGNTGDYRIGWQLAGTFNGAPVNGSGRAGSVLSLREQAKYPVDAHVRIGKTRIDASGTLTEPGKLAALDLRLKIAGVSMAQLYPLINIVLPETPPFSTEGHLTGAPGAMGGNWNYEKFSGKVGASDIAGSLRFQGRRPRPYLEGTVRSNYLNFKDLAPLIGADSNESKALRDAPVRQPEDKTLPVEAFKTGRWTSIDADVQFTGKKIVRKAELPIDNLVTRIHLLDGTLSLAPLKFGVAGGALVSNLTLDGKTNPVQAEMKLSARHLKLRQLFPTLEPMRTSLGEINGDAALTARGNSVAALLGSSNGEVKAVINQGTVSKFLLEAMGLNIGSVVVTQLFGDRQVKLNCAVTDFVMDKGIMHPRAFVVDTEDAKIHVNGNIDLGREQLALTIYPESTGLRVISLRSPLYVNGTFKNPDVGVNKGVLAAKAGSAVALGLLAPVAAALIPLVNVGPGEKSECGTLLAQAAATTKPVAPVVGKQGENASGR